jgi:dienelactone hydrolase
MAERVDVSFDSGGESCAAWLYRPPQATACVVIAHGWTGVREQRLDAFAEHFADAGLAALVFDYRHFGASAGEPRQLLDIARQHADWRAAVAYVRGLEGIDPNRIALWGTSFSGGHVIVTAARDPAIAAVVAQVPFVDGLASVRRLPVAHQLQLTLAGLRDQLGALAGRPAHMVASVGPPGSVAVMNSPDAEPGFRALCPPGLQWPNRAAARIVLRAILYRPIRSVGAVRCPILFTIGQDDVITPPDLAEAAAARAPRAEVRRYPGGHFDLYVGEGFDCVIPDETEFLLAHLGAPAPLAGAGAGAGAARS